MRFWVLPNRSLFFPTFSEMHFLENGVSFFSTGLNLLGLPWEPNKGKRWSVDNLLLKKNILILASRQLWISNIIGWHRSSRRYLYNSSQYQINALDYFSSYDAVLITQDRSQNHGIFSTFSAVVLLDFSLVSSQLFRNKHT